jgi:taurine transport system permease protein
MNRPLATDAQPVLLPGASVGLNNARPKGRPRLGGRSRRLINILIGLAFGIGIWEILSVIIADTIFLPSPWLTVKTFAFYMHHPYPSAGVPLWEDAYYSTRRIVIGFAAGSAIGLVLGSLMSSIRFIRNVLDPLIEGIRPLPPLAFIPVLIVWFGVGDEPKIVLIMMCVLPIMTISTVSALDQVPPDLMNVGRCLGASNRYVMLRVRARAAVSPLITGMRVSMGVSWGSIVAAEMIVATNGIGYVILQAGLYLSTALIFAGILSIAILGVTFDAFFRAVQRRLDPSLRKALGNG